jgi:hypothetical protein
LGVARPCAFAAIALSACSPNALLVPVALPPGSAGFTSVIGFRHGSGPQIHVESANLGPDLTLRFESAHDGDRIDLLFYTKSLYELGSVPTGPLPEGTGGMSAAVPAPESSFFGTLHGTGFDGWTPESKDQLPPEIAGFQYALTGTASPYCPTFKVQPVLVQERIGVTDLVPFGSDGAVNLPTEDLAEVYLVTRTGARRFFTRANDFMVRSLFFQRTPNIVWAGIQENRLAKFSPTATTATTAVPNPFVHDWIVAMDGAPDGSELAVLTHAGTIARLDASGWNVLGSQTASITGNLDFGHPAVLWIGPRHEIVVDNSPTVRILRDDQLLASEPIGSAVGTHITAVVRTGTAGDSYVLGALDGMRLEFFTLDPAKDTWRAIPGASVEMRLPMRAMSGAANGVLYLARDGGGGYVDTAHGIACPRPPMSFQTYGGAVNSAVLLPNGDVVFGGDLQRNGGGTPVYFMKLLF